MTILFEILIEWLITMRAHSFRLRQLTNGIVLLITLLMLLHIVIILFNRTNRRNMVSLLEPDQLDVWRFTRGIQSIEEAEQELQDLQRPMPEPLKMSSNAEPFLLTRAPYVDRSLSLPHLFAMDNQNLSAVAAAIQQINDEQTIFHATRYNRTDFVLVIQVHDRVEYLRLLVRSLARAKDIHRVLLIFSHDVYDAEINRLVHSIGFTKVLQVFFPYSQQLYPKQFPGADPLDCPRDIVKSEAVRRGCTNANWPDKYGHYREAKYCQTKHHWLWKNNVVFEKIPSLRNFTGLYLFVEEDHYMSEDFLHVLHLMETTSALSYPDLNILCLGTYEKKPTFKGNTGQFQTGKWISSFHNMGMAFKRELWSRMRDCVRMFCEFDDYNWDWSMMYLSRLCGQPAKPYQVMLLINSPRIFHIGECGVHHKGKSCSPTRLVSQIDAMLDQNLKYLYPRQLTPSGVLTFRETIPKPNGGWGDKRDHSLCLSYVLGEDANFPIKQHNHI